MGFEKMFEAGVILRLTDDLTSPANQAIATLNKLETRARAFEKQSRRMAKTGAVIGAMGVGIAMGLKAPIKAAMEYSEGIAEISTIAGANNVEMAKMDKGLLKLSPPYFLKRCRRRPLRRD